MGSSERAFMSKAASNTIFFYRRCLNCRVQVGELPAFMGTHCKVAMCPPFAFWSRFIDVHFSLSSLAFLFVCFPSQKHEVDIVDVFQYLAKVLVDSRTPP